MTVTRIACAHCGKLFAPTRAGQKFHNDACRMKAAHAERQSGARATRRLAERMLAALMHFYDSSEDNEHNPTMQSVGRVIDSSLRVGLKPRR